MKTTKTHGLILGLGILGATTLLSALEPAQARPNGHVIQYRRRPTFQVLTGRVTRDYRGNGFLLITDRGSTYRVTVIGGEPRRISVGDRVRVSGSYTGGAFRARTLVILRNR